MVSLRSHSRAHASSSSTRGSHSIQTNENVPQGRRALGDVKNVLVDSPLVGNNESRRKPLSDRNAPIEPRTRETKKKAAARTTRSNAYAAQKASTTRSKRVPVHLTMDYELADSSQADAAPAPLQARQAEADAPQVFSHVQVPPAPGDVASFEGDALSAQIEAAARRAEESARARDEFSRLSPGLSSDDLEYFDIGQLQQTQSAGTAAAQIKRSRSPGSKNRSSEEDAVASHGSSDKENVPPQTSGHGQVPRDRHSARSRAGVLRTIEAEQPTHSTPISQNRKIFPDDATGAAPYLDDLFLVDSDSTSRQDSPGTARRAAPLTASAQQLLDHRTQGVSKVTAWKAAGHHAVHLASDSDDISHVGSWREEDEGANVDQGQQSEDDDDEFGFLYAERNLRERSMQALGEAFSLQERGSQPSEGDAGHVFVDIPTDPFNTSDDRRLAEQIFGRMSSPEHAYNEPSSSTAPPSSVVHLGDDKEQASPQNQLESEVEGMQAEGGSLPLNELSRESSEADTSNRRVTRSVARRKSDEATVAVDDQRSAKSTLPPAAKSTRRTAKTRRTVSGIPLKRTEKKEQEILQKLAAEASSSPTSSSVASLRASKTRKRGAASPTTKELYMEDILHFLPPRKRAEIKGETKARGSSARKAANKAAKTSTMTTSSSKSKKAKSKNPETPANDDSVGTEDGFEDLLTSKVTKPSKRSAANNGKASVVSETQRVQDAGQEKWRTTVGSSSIHSDDSERTKRLKEIRAAEKYDLQFEMVL